MNNIIQKINNSYKLIVVGFFACYLFIGLNIYKDYGLSWDEWTERITGHVNLNHIQNLITGKKFTPQYEKEYLESLLPTLEPIGLFGTRAHINPEEPLDSYQAKYYGPVFECLMDLTEKILQMDFYKNSSEVYKMRHLITFLYFYLSVVIFYKMGKLIFNSWSLGLLGAVFLVLSPRIFAHSFYNPKDIPCLSSFIFCTYTALLFLRNLTIKNAVLHAATCAIATNIRVMGILIPALTFFIFILKILFDFKKPENKGQKIGYFVLFGLLYILFVIVLWPILWSDPINNFIHAFKHMSNHRWEGDVFYLGKIIKAQLIPWHYVFVWMSVTIPPMYIIFFILALIMIVGNIKKLCNLEYLINTLLVFSWFFAPILAVLILKSTLYDEWRQLFFVYPAFILISIYGIKFLFEWLSNFPILRVITLILISCNLLYLGYLMINTHPYQNVYFNFLAGKSNDEIRSKFELDYWGLSFRKGLEYILEHDDAPLIKVAGKAEPCWSTINMLPWEQKKRLSYVMDVNEADYYLTNFRSNAEQYHPKLEWFTINVNGQKILAVLKFKGLKRILQPVNFSN